jgi:acetyltransferase-like isoleucine patch superfamily enzyme
VSDDLLDPLRRIAGDLVQSGWEQIQRLGTLGPRHRRARRFQSFGNGSAICFPVTALYGERYIRLGSRTIIGPHATLSAGVSPEHVLERETVVSIGDRCLIGRGSGVVAHESVEIGDDVFTGHHVYITDANHGYADVDVPIGRQFAPPRPVRIGAGSWLGHGAIVLPGSTIGRHVVIGAGAVVAGDIPDFSVAVGNPARVIRRYVTGRGWIAVGPPDGRRTGEVPEPPETDSRVEPRPAGAT